MNPNPGHQSLPAKDESVDVVFHARDTPGPAIGGDIEAQKSKIQTGTFSAWAAPEAASTTTTSGFDAIVGLMTPQARSGGRESVIRHDLHSGATRRGSRRPRHADRVRARLLYGSRAATGADTFGYVSKVDLWLKGDLTLEQPLSKEFPGLHPEQSLTPLGYRPGQVRHTIVPVYSPG